MPGASRCDNAAPLRLNSEPGDRDVTVAKAAAVLRRIAPRISSLGRLRYRRDRWWRGSVRHGKNEREDNKGTGALVKREGVRDAPCIRCPRSRPRDRGHLSSEGTSRSHTLSVCRMPDARPRGKGARCTQPYTSPLASTLVETSQCLSNGHVVMANGSKRY